MQIGPKVGEPSYSSKSLQPGLYFLAVVLHTLLPSSGNIWAVKALHTILSPSAADA